MKIFAAFSAIFSMAQAGDREKFIKAENIERFLRDLKFFEEVLFSDIMKSERLRAFILGVIALSSSLVSSLVYFFFSADFPPQTMEILAGLPFILWLTAGFVILALYETAVYLWLGYLVSRGKKWPAPFRVMNTLFETSIPTMALFAGGEVFGYHIFMTPVIYLYFIFILLSALRLSFGLSLFSGVIAGSGYITASLFLVSAGGIPAEFMLINSTGLHIIRGIILMAAGALTGLVAIRIRKSIMNTYRTVTEKERIVSIFGQHVSPSVVNMLLEKDSSLSEMRNVCVLFLDIRNFTRFSESKEPGEVVDFLNYLFDFMIEIINSHNGIINKFLGDGFMAVFGAPLTDSRDSVNAVNASMRIIERLHDEVEHGRIPDTRIGIGIHRGMALTGSIGSSQRREYTVIGDVVNLASRIESINKNYDSQLIVSEDVFSGLGEGVKGEDLDYVDIRGRKDPVRLYRLA